MDDYFVFTGSYKSIYELRITFDRTENDTRAYDAVEQREEEDLYVNAD